MPYQTVQELPETVKENLPEHGQDIYKESFNSAWNQYAQGGKGGRSREEAAHTVAWSAVKKEYEKDAKGNWVRKDQL